VPAGQLPGGSGDVRIWRMDQSASREPDTPSAPLLRDHAGGIVATATVLALLYFGRDVLVPVTLAVILSLAVAPLVRVLRRLGLGQTLSVLGAVLMLTLACAAVAVVIGIQVVRMTQSLPQYEETIRYKLSTLNEMTVGRLNILSGQARRIVSQKAAKRLPAAAARALGEGDRSAHEQPAFEQAAAEPEPIPVEIREPPTNSLQVVQKVLGSLWVPLETAGIVLIVLIFVLLEHEAVRDRFIRIAGGTDIRATTLALNDAGERLSRFFVSQFLVNLGVAGAVWVGLTIAGLPHALLWGAIAGVLRFVPYVGVWIAALFCTVLAAAVDPGWGLAITTVALFVVVELIAGQLVEPQLYGHTTGLSPLSVVVAAIFWSWVWGPVGLIVSTPLTLCLVVAGRHIRALSLLDLLLGDNQPLTMPQRFYQRALSADADEIIASARTFLKRNSFATYCDVVLMPALYLARLDIDTGAINAEQLARVRDTIVAVIGAIGGEGRRSTKRPARNSVLDQSTIGRRLRSQREQLSGPFQGPLSVPPGSVMLCVGLGSTSDDLATELLVRILRDQKVDARHMSIEDLNAPPPPDASPGGVSVVYLVSAFPSEERSGGQSTAEKVRERFPGVCLVTVFLPGILLQPGPQIDTVPSADRAATSFGHAAQICLSLQQDKIKEGAVREVT
jgi:predicted PurR-regulated permease PerM